MLRDSQGKVLFHSRKAFESAESKKDNKLKVFLWTMESMQSHHVEKVIFASQDSELVGALLRPKVTSSGYF